MDKLEYVGREIKRQITSISPQTYIKTILIFAFVVWLRKSKIERKYKIMISIGISMLMFSYARVFKTGEDPNVVKPIILSKDERTNDYNEPGLPDTYIEGLERFQSNRVEPFFDGEPLGEGALNFTEWRKRISNIRIPDLPFRLPNINLFDTKSEEIDTTDYSHNEEGWMGQFNDPPQEHFDLERGSGVVSINPLIEEKNPEYFINDTQNDIETFQDTPVTVNTPKETIAIVVENHEPFWIQKRKDSDFGVIDIAQPENYIELKELKLGSNYTIQFWVRLNVIGNSNNSLITVFNPEGSKILDISYERYREDQENVYLIIQDSTIPIKKSSWTHVVIIRGRGQSRLGGSVYINGIFSNFINNLPDFSKYAIGRSYLFKGVCCSKKSFNENLTNTSNLSVLTLWNRSLSMTEAQSLFIDNSSYFNSVMNRPISGSSKPVSESLVFHMDARDVEGMRAILSTKIKVKMPWNEVQADIMELKNARVVYPEEIKTPVDVELYARMRKAEEDRNKRSNWLDVIMNEIPTTSKRDNQSWERAFDANRVRNTVGEINEPQTGTPVFS